MLPRDDVPTVLRIVQGIRGKVDMTLDLIIRFDYGSVVPWVRTITCKGVTTPLSKYSSVWPVSRMIWV